MTAIRLNPYERKVLRFLAARFSDDMGFYGFAGITRGTRLNRNTVRLACRSLTRKGLARFARGLCDDDGDFRGSGYAATALGATTDATDNVKIRSAS